MQLSIFFENIFVSTNIILCAILQNTNGVVIFFFLRACLAMIDSGTLVYNFWALAKQEGVSILEKGFRNGTK